MLVTCMTYYEVRNIMFRFNEFRQFIKLFKLFYSEPGKREKNKELRVRYMAPMSG